jgi:RNA polymerase sigma factor (sigma-70 family)
MSVSPRDTLMALLVTAYPDLKKRLVGRLGSTDRASEALHDTYLRLHRSEIVGEVRNPRSYLLTMALNIASNQARSEAKHLSAAEVETLIELPDATPDPTRIAEARSELGAVEQALQALPVRRRAIFRRFWVESATYKEISLEYNVSERTVRHELLLASRHLHAATEDFCVTELQKRLAQVSSK